METILTPNWSCSEPNMASALRKNDNGICAMHECDNKLSDPPAYGFLGVKICNECRKRFDKMAADIRQEMINEVDEYIIERYTRYFENKEKSMSEDYELVQVHKSADEMEVLIRDRNRYKAFRGKLQELPSPKSVYPPDYFEDETEWKKVEVRLNEHGGFLIRGGDRSAKHTWDFSAISSTSGALKDVVQEITPLDEE